MGGWTRSSRRRPAAGDDDNRRSHGKSTTRRQAEQPGIMPTLYGRHLIGNTIFLSLKDVAEDLPSYDEHPTSVRMSAELAEPYREVEAKLKDAVAQLLRRGNHQLLSGMLHALLAYPDYPYDWKTIGYVDGSGGPNGRFVHVTTPPTLDRDTLWPKERKLLEILAEEKAQGRQVWVFCMYTSTHPVLGRLEKIIQDAGYTVKVLDADKVPTRSRSAWIARNAPGVDVIISHPQPVRTGLTLFDAMGGHNFPTLDFLRDWLRSCSRCVRRPAARGGSASGIPAASTTSTTGKRCRHGRWASWPRSSTPRWPWKASSPPRAWPRCPPTAAR